MTSSLPVAKVLKVTGIDSETSLPPEVSMTEKPTQLCLVEIKWTN